MTDTPDVAYRESAPGLRLRIEPDPPPLAATDTVIFDIDGVLVEVRESFRVVISLAVQHFFNRILGVPGETLLVSPDETALFKLAGRYNNDWDLAQGAVAWGLAKLVSIDGVERSIQALRAAEPGLEEFTARVRDSGGGLDTTLCLVRRDMEGVRLEQFERLYQPELVKRIFQEYYSGPEHCRAFYGFDPQYYNGPGLVEKERHILDLGRVERLSGLGVAFGVLSGRTVEEADYVLARLGLDKLLHPRGLVVDDGSIPPKPDPAGLMHLAREMKFKQAIYVGDVPDDWTTVTAYRVKNPGRPRISGCMVLTGANPGGRLTRHFMQAGVDSLATDVNVLLKALEDSKSGGR